MSVTANKLFNFVDGAFERMLKLVFSRTYPLQPIFVERAIEKAIAANTKVFRDGVLPPNRIKVLLNSDDYADFKKIEGIYRSKLENTASEFIENEFKEQAIGTAKPVIFVEAAPDVVRGEVRVNVEYHEASYGRTR